MQVGGGGRQSRKTVNGLERRRRVDPKRGRSGKGHREKADGNPVRPPRTVERWKAHLALESWGGKHTLGGQLEDKVGHRPHHPTGGSAKKSACLAVRGGTRGESGPSRGAERGGGVPRLVKRYLEGEGVVAKCTFGQGDVKKKT